MTQEIISDKQQNGTNNKRIVKNETARRIGIESKTDKKNRLIIPPFGSRAVTLNVLSEYAYEKWEEQNLITIETVKGQDNRVSDSRAAVAGCLFMLFILFLIISIPTAAISPDTISWRTVGIGVLFFFIALVIGFAFMLSPKRNEKTKEKSRHRWRKFGQWLARLPSLLLVIFIGLGIPALVVYFWGGGIDLIKTIGSPNPVLLGRILQLGLIAIASIFPALLYFLFGRQQLEKLRKDFFRAVMLLDPDIQTSSEARTKYDPLFDNIYGSGDAQQYFGSSIPILISTLLITIGWTLLLLPIGVETTLDNGNLLRMLTPHASALNFGFLGVYFFTVNMVFRRYIRADLTTKTYTHISVRLLLTIILVWVVSYLPQFIGIANQASSPGLLILAFLIGILPETGTVLVQDFNRKVFGGIIPSLKEDHPVTNLEGVNLYDRARLLEEGIENVENLAHHNFIELVARTRIPTARLVDLFDQAILYLHLGLDADQVKEARRILRSYGIRTATDLQQFSKKMGALNLKGESSINDSQTANLLKKLEVILHSLSDDEWIGYLKYWRKSVEQSKKVCKIEDFYSPEYDQQDNG